MKTVDLKIHVIEIIRGLQADFFAPPMDMVFGAVLQAMEIKKIHPRSVLPEANQIQ